MAKMRKVLAATMAAAMAMSMLAGCGDAKTDSTEEQKLFQKNPRFLYFRK